MELVRKQSGTISRYQNAGRVTCEKSTAGFQGKVELADSLDPENLGFTLDATHIPEPTRQTRLLLLPAVPSSTPSDAQLSAKTIPTEEESKERLRCAAIQYLELVGVNAQLQISHRQQQDTVRLLKVATLRVRRGVNDPQVLTRAKLLRAKAALATMELETSAQRLRKQLAELTGLAEENIQPIADSVPPVPDIPTDSPDLQGSMKQMAARRDVAQLEFVLARTDRDRAQVKGVEATATVVDLLTAYIAEDEKLRVLIQRILELQLARLSVVQISGKIEQWIAGDMEKAEGVSDQRPHARGETAGSDKLGMSLTLRTILITPAISKLVAGRSQQLSAIAIYTDGKAKDVSSEATWRCSSDSAAVVSTSGMITALTAGQVTISITVSGVSQTRQITITDEPQDF